jgi:hypothetical protein
MMREHASARTVVDDAGSGQFSIKGLAINAQNLSGSRLVAAA